MEIVKVKSGKWNTTVMWPGIVEQTARAARLIDEEKKKLSSSLAAQVIAATAYLSGCKDPDRIAVAHLTTFAGAFRCPELFGYRNKESLAERLLAGNHFPGGDPEIVKAGMLILELLSLNDHKNDFRQDLISGKANPLVSHLNYDAALGKIRKEYDQLPGHVKDKFQRMYSESIKNWLWS